MHRPKLDSPSTRTGLVLAAAGLITWASAARRTRRAPAPKPPTPPPLPRSQDRLDLDAWLDEVLAYSG